MFAEGFRPAGADRAGKDDKPKTGVRVYTWHSVFFAEPDKQTRTPILIGGVLVILSLLLAGCGNKGDLYLPDRQEQPGNG